MSISNVMFYVFNDQLVVMDMTLATHIQPEHQLDITHFITTNTKRDFYSDGCTN